jgi:hypothetical protein
MIRAVLLAAALPLAAMAQLELTLYDSASNTETPIGSSYDIGDAAVCETLSTPEIRLRNIGQDIVQVNTVEPQSGAISVTGAPLPPFPLGSGALQAMGISFTPTAVAPYLATLNIQGTDTVTSTVYTLNVALTAQGVTAPTLSDSTGHQYCPGPNDPIDIGRTQVGTTLQMSLTLNNVTQTTASVSLAGADFALVGGAFTVQPGASQTFQIGFTPSVANRETAVLSVNDLSWNLYGDGFVQPVLLQPSLVIAGNDTASSSQATVSIPLAAAATAAVTGQLSLAFQPAGNLPDDPNIVFTANSSRSIAVQVNPGDTAAQFTAGDPNACTFQTGTTAGTITFSLSLGEATITASTTIGAADVSLDLATASAATNQIIVSLTGFDNTHAASMLAFTFYNAAGQPIPSYNAAGQPDPSGLIQANVAGDFASYYTANPSAGGAFALQATFPVSGDITQVASVEVQFTNPVGVATNPGIPVN